MLNSQYIHSSLAPWYLLAGISTYSDETLQAEVVEGTVNMALQDVADKIISKSPQIIGFCCYIWNIAFIHKLLPVIKKALPEAVIILGGPEVSFNAGDVLRDEPLVDYVIAGEGEKPFAELLRALGTGEDNAGVRVHLMNAASIPGICYRVDGEPVVAPPHCPSEEPPSPYVTQYFEALNGRIAYLETSRGCPFSCAFCLSGRMGGIRFFNLDRAKRDILLLAGSGTQTVKLVDRTFNVDRKRALELFRFIIENYGKAIPSGVRFHFEIAGDLLDEETLNLLGTAPVGALQFEIGLQSFNAETLEVINRKTDIGLLTRNIERLIAFGNIHIHIDLIAGLPHEDYISFANSFNTAYALKPHMLQLGFLKLLHGSPMRAAPELFPCQFASEPPYQVLQTPWLSINELEKLHHAEAALERLYNSGRFHRTLLYVLEQTGMTPFELFICVGGIIHKSIAEQTSLDSFTAEIFDFFGVLNGVEKMALRDTLVCDRLATNSTGRLPKALQIADVALKKTIQKVTRPEHSVKRGYAILYSEDALVYADYAEQDPVSGEYALKRVPLSR